MIGLIAAVAPDGLIASAGKIPWHYPLDLKFFKETTEGCTVVMGRKTWLSLPEKFRPLRNRKNLVLTNDHGPARAALSPYAVGSMHEALSRAEGSDVWIIGGAEVYRLGMLFADQIVLTLVDDMLHPWDIVSPLYFPWISPQIWRDRITEHPDPRLSVARYWKKAR